MLGHVHNSNLGIDRVGSFIGILAGALMSEGLRLTNLSSVCLPEEKRISICTFVLLIRSKFTSFSQSMLWRVVGFGRAVDFGAVRLRRAIGHT